MSDLVEIFVTETAEEVTLNVTPNLIEVNVIKGIAPTNPITGSGTVNRIPKFTGASTLGNSLIFDNGTNVGIGTTSPSARLHVAGYAIFDDGTNGRLTFENVSGQNDIYSTTTAFGAFKNLRLSSNELILATGGTTERLRITSTGNVGIGTTAPTSRLHVNGLPSFADNTTAIAGGLTVGAFYHTAGVLKVVI
jgi:hypothetical protein